MTMFFKRVVEVDFELRSVLEAGDDEHEEDHDDPEDDEGDELHDGPEIVSATICCMNELSLADFANQLEQYKGRIVSDLGYADPDVEIRIVRVEDVSADHNITMFPPPQQKSH